MQDEAVQEEPAFVPDRKRPVSYIARCGLLFVLLYLLLYGLPFPLGQIPAQDDKWPVEAAATEVADWLRAEGEEPEPLPRWVGYPSKWHKELTEEVEEYTAWFGENVLALEKVEPVSTGSGDTLFDWVRAALMLALAVLAAPLLALLVRGRGVLGWLHGCVRVYARYALAATMCSYGFVKLFPLQFPALAGERLYGTYGDASPMNVLWSFMGASEPYTVFTGIAEVLGGVLLLWRRTATLGALVSLAVMTHVLVLNLCYDVPVKLFSAHMVLFAAFVLAPDLPRLWAVFFSHRGTEPVRLRMRVPVWVLAPWFVLKLTAIAVVIGVPLQSAWSTWNRMQELEGSALAGIWEVREFARTEGGEPVAPGEHWERLVITYWPWEGETFCVGSIAKASGSKVNARVTVDAEQGTLELQPMGGAEQALALSYTERSQLVEGSEEPVRQLVLTADGDGQQMRALLEHRDESTFRLKRTGFRWIQERPWNLNSK